MKIIILQKAAAIRAEPDGVTEAVRLIDGGWKHFARYDFQPTA